MKERDVRSILVSHVGEVVGIVSKTDILFKVMSQGRNPGKVRLREIMTSPVLAVGPHNTVQETLSIMDKHIIRQVIISSHSAVLGMVSRDDIFEKINMATVSTAHTVSLRLIQKKGCQTTLTGCTQDRAYLKAMYVECLNDCIFLFGVDTWTPQYCQ